MCTWHPINNLDISSTLERSQNWGRRLGKLGHNSTVVHAPVNIIVLYTPWMFTGGGGGVYRASGSALARRLSSKRGEISKGDRRGGCSIIANVMSSYGHIFPAR